MSTPATNSAPASTNAAAPAAAATNAAAAQPNPASQQPADTSNAKAPESAKPAAAPEAPKQPTQAEIRRLKLKLDGQDIDLPEEEVIRLAQMSGAAQKRFQEAAAEKKRATEVLEYLKSNKKDALKKLGVDLRKFSEDTLTEIIKQEQETPEAKQLREAQEKLREYDAKETERKNAEEAKKVESEKQAKLAAEQKKHAEIIAKYDRIFTDALAKADVPKTQKSVVRMAQLQRINIKKGYELDADSLAKIVSEDYRKELVDHVSNYKTSDGKGLDGEKILAMLGPEVEKAITQAKIARLKNSKPQFSKPAETAQTTAAPSNQQKGAWRSFTRKSRVI